MAHPRLCVMVMTHRERRPKDIQHPGGRVVLPKESGGLHGGGGSWLTGMQDSESQAEERGDAG